MATSVVVHPAAQSTRRSTFRIWNGTDALPYPD
jgi:hypothetical protein